MYDQQVFSWHVRGGVGKYFSQLAIEMPKMQVETLLPFAFSVTEHYFEMGGRRLSQVSKRRGAVHLCRALNHVSRLTFQSKPDIWHSTYYDPQFLKIHRGFPMVCTIHDMIPELFGIEGQKALGLDKKKYAKSATRVIAVSDNTKRDAVRIFDLDPEKIDVIHHGIDIAGCAKHQINLPSEFLLYVGSRADYKNFNRLLECVPILRGRYPNLHLICAGSEFSLSERELMRKLGVTSASALKMNDAQLRYAFERAALFVYPSLYEGFGIPILEAMAAGCPVVISNSSSFPEVARDAAEYFDPMSAEMMADAMISVLASQDKRRALVSRGRLLVKEYSVEKMIMKTIGLYERVIEMS